MEKEFYGKCTILAGISGAGKTHLRDHLEPTSVFSTDDFWTKDGEDYDESFDPRLLGEAHNWNLRRFVAASQALPELVMANIADGATDEDIAKLTNRHLVVDNTNTTLAELAPYYQVALAFGLDVKVTVLLCPWHVATKRNVHGVTAPHVHAMSQRLDKMIADMPPWWKKEILYNG